MSDEKTKDTKDTKDTRTRNWNLIVYPDSAPSNWRELIDEWQIEWIESPLHDKDVSANGEPKKAHYHVLLMFSGVKTYEQVREITDPLNCPIPQKCHNAKASTRYMAHMDDANKAQYDSTLIKTHGGVDIRELLKPTTSERYSLIDEMLEFIDSQGIVEFKHLMKYARLHRRDDWFPLLCDSSTIMITAYIRSNRYCEDK
jgi:hypothetical protein